MKRGSTSLELTLTFEYESDGNNPRVTSIEVDGVELFGAVANLANPRLFKSLPWSVQDKLTAAAWDEAEDCDSEDEESDEARVPGAAE